MAAPRNERRGASRRERLTDHVKLERRHTTRRRDDRRTFPRIGDDIFGHGFARNLPMLGEVVGRDRFLSFCSQAADLTAPPKTMVVAAHQDDEVIGVGGRLPRLKSDVLIVHVTDGAPRDLKNAIEAGFSIREQYAAACQEEVREALEVAGLVADQSITIGIPDQEATLNLVALTRRLVELFDAYKPEIVVTHSYEGGHTDHDSTAFAVQGAWRMLRDAGAKVPVVLEMTSYHLRTGDRTFFEFLPWSEGEVWTVTLSEAERNLKREMFRRFRSQWSVVRRFPLQVERFRQAPAYDFTQPPAPGTLDYERFEVAIRGEKWREYAKNALNELGLTPG
ncbi:MAG: PIG-L family deacetylase [Gemmatimonadota bacterium]|nr:PIG-L family deacetylase [Gemmatimonadota bacterium]